MSAENTILTQDPAPATDPAESADQQELALENTEGTADESRASETTQEETDEQKAARLVKEQQIRQRRERNREAAERRILEKERDTYRQVVEQFLDKQGRGEAAPARQSPQQSEPTRDFNPETGKPFETYDEFVVARAEWRAEQRAMATIEKRLSAAAEAMQVQQNRVNAASVRRAHEQRMEEFARQNPDFEAIAARDDVQIPSEAGGIIARMRNGPALILALAQQPDLAANLRGMESPLEMATYLGQLSQWLDSSKSSAISNAAPAGRTVGTKPASSSTPPDDPDEYERWATKRFGR